MRKILCVFVLAGAITVTAALCGCNTNPQDTASNGSGIGTSSGSMPSNPSSGANGSSDNPIVSSESDELISAVFWENQRYF